MIRASILIPVYNRPADLLHVLRQLTMQTQTDFEVIVVDDGSSPPIENFIGGESFPFPITLKRHETCLGVGKARNTAVQAAQSEFLLFIDSDGDISDPEWFSKFLRAYEETRILAEKKGKPLIVAHGPVSGISKGYWGKSDSFSNWFGSSKTFTHEVRDLHVPMHNTGVPRKVFDIVGFFDETLRVCEDVEWSFRCMDHGIALFFMAGASIGHFDRNGFSAFWQHYYEFGRYALLVRERKNTAPYRFLFPRGAISAALLFFPTTLLMTLYVLYSWILSRPGVVLYLPGLYLANAASYAGMCSYLFEMRRSLR